MELKEICKKARCTGCMACQNVCHSDSIILIEDSMGFKYPMIDTKKCKSCGLCYKICPVNSPTHKNFPSECYAMTYPNLLQRVASGGAATAISELIISNGGVVYGCSGLDIRNVKHVRIDDISKLNSIVGSKYVQSDISNIYSGIISDIASGRDVLMIGTPCQIGGVYNFLRKDYPNFFTIDLVCHGVSSQRMLNDNIKYYEDKYAGMSINQVQFRKKIENKGQYKIDYGFYFQGNKRTEIIDKSVKWYDDPFMFGFLKGVDFRECCYDCAYSYNVRGGDLTISDFWGLDQDAGFINGKGVSGVLVNTEKGQSIIRQLKNRTDVKLVERSVRESITGNGNLMCPSQKPNEYHRFVIDYPKMGLYESLHKLMKRERLKMRLKNIIRFVKLKMNI